MSPVPLLGEVRQQAGKAQAMAAAAGVVRSAATSDPALAEVPDYADCFEVTLREPDGRTAEEWARAALEGMPPALRALVLLAHRRVLRLRLGPLEGTDHVLGWRVVTSQPDLVQLVAEGSLLRGVILGRRTGPTTAVIRTAVFFRARPAARLTWVLVGPLHRRVAPYLLQRAARS